VDTYSCFSELADHETRGKDYDLVIRSRLGSDVAVIAPHGGGIEWLTCTVAEQIAGTNFSLYCFRGLKRTGNNTLHLTSHHFDEPECLDLIARHPLVLAVHGCIGSGEEIFSGGLDEPLISDLTSALTEAGIRTEQNGHPYPGINPRNICNRGERNAGAQLELSAPFRQSKSLPLFVEVVRRVLMAARNRL